MDFPEVLIFDAANGKHDAAEELDRRIAGTGVEAPFVLSSRHGQELADRIRSPFDLRIRPPRADQAWAAELGSEVHRMRADAIVAAGGGLTLDVGKLAAARAGVTIIAVPTQLSHDGICSPVAVVPDERGRAQSLGAIAPRMVFVSVPTIVGAPLASVRAGIGDLLANPLALRDWALAVERGLEEMDERAWQLSLESHRLIEPHLDTDMNVAAKDADFLKELANALILSGMAMISSGTSRPASGGEHEISHAIDRLYGGRALHGAQVAFGCILSVALYEDDVESFRVRLERLGLPQHPSELGLSENDMVTVLLEAPNTRPGRFTILEDADLDDATARALVRRIWGQAW
ncbi:MAG: iron-containing alcohol dehydrogenase [Actinomycetota bacterium]